MPTIAIVDDDPRSRDSDVRSLNTHLPKDKGWAAIAIHPFPHLKDYPSWIAENEIAVLLVDEKLGGRAADASKHVNYEGHDLIKSLRRNNKTLPLYFLTNFAGNTPVTQRFADVEDIISKNEFKKNRAKYVARFTRKGGEYFKSFRNQLAQLNDLSLKIAKGEATAEDKKNAKAIQLNLELPHIIEPSDDRSEWLEKYEDKVKEFEGLRKEIETYFKQKSRKKKR